MNYCLFQPDSDVRKLLNVVHDAYFIIVFERIVILLSVFPCENFLNKENKGELNDHIH